MGVKSVTNALPSWQHSPALANRTEYAVETPKKTPAWKPALAIAGLLSAALIVSSAIGSMVTAAPSSAPQVVDSSHSSTAPTGRIKAHAWIKIYGKHGKVIYRHTYPASTAGKTMHLPKKAMLALKRVSRTSGTEGSSSASGTATAGVGQVDQGPSGGMLWQFNSYLNFKWNRANHTVDMISHSYDPWQHLSSVWDWNGLVTQSHHVFVWNDTNLFGHSGYHSMYQGKYSGPNAIHAIVHEYPHNVLEAHSDGTWYWQHTCCGPPGS